MKGGQSGEQPIEYKKDRDEMLKILGKKTLKKDLEFFNTSSSGGGESTEYGSTRTLTDDEIITMPDKEGELFVQSEIKKMELNYFQNIMVKYTLALIILSLARYIIFDFLVKEKNLSNLMMQMIAPSGNVYKFQIKIILHHPIEFLKKDNWEAPIKEIDTDFTLFINYKGEQIYEKYFESLLNPSYFYNEGINKIPSLYLHKRQNTKYYIVENFLKYNWDKIYKNTVNKYKSKFNRDNSVLEINKIYSFVLKDELPSRDGTRTITRMDRQYLFSKDFVY